MPPIVERHAVLRRTAHEFEFVRPRIEREIATADVNGHGVLRSIASFDIAAVGARRDVQPIVESPTEAVEQALDVAGAEAGKDEFLLVRILGIDAAVAVGVFEIENVRRVGDEQPAVERKEGRRPEQAVDEDGALIELAVAVEVVEHADARVLAVAVLAIAAHLADEEPAVLVELHRDGAIHQRLGGDLFELKTRGDGKRLHRVGR